MRRCCLAHFCFTVVCLITVCSLFVGASSVGASTPASEASDLGAALTQDAKCPGGVCVVLGDSADLAASISRQGEFVVQTLVGNAHLSGIRETFDRAGISGRVSAHAISKDQLPYAENVVNILVLPSSRANQELLEETYRVLTPLGVAYLLPEEDEEAFDRSTIRKQAKAVGLVAPDSRAAEERWIKLQKPWPAEIDEWTHHLHGADGNAVAHDRVVGPPRHYQWLGGPRWAQSHESDSNLRCLVTARGRLYYIVNEAPTSLAGPESPPDKWFLTARDAFNGVVLWKVPIREWGWRQWKPSWFTPRPGVIPINLDKRVVAAGDLLFVTLGYRAPVSKVDGRTGEILQTFECTARASEILYHNGQLLVTVNQSGRSVVKRVDATTGQLLWTSANDYGGTNTDYYRFTARGGKVPEAEVDATLDIATDGSVVGLLDGKSVVCLDYETGKEKWRTEFPLAEADHNAGRIQARDRVWTGTMIVHDGILIHASPNNLAGLSTDTGEVLWQQPKTYLQHLWYEWKDVFVIDDLVWTWGSELAREPFEGAKGSSTFPVRLHGYHPRTGECIREVPLGKIFKTYHHHRCYRNKATDRFVIASRRGSEFVDISGGPHSVNNWVRGTCHMGMMPANGLQYAPPHPCQCYVDEKLNGMNALAPQIPERWAWEDSAEPRLEKGPLFRSPNSTSTAHATDSDWPTYRSDPSRSGSVKTDLPKEIEKCWQIDLGSKVGPITAVGDRVFVPLVDGHALVAIDAVKGKELWRFHTGARIDSPPTFHQGSLLFGSADGYVYRVRADVGQLEWRFRAAPHRRQIGAYGQLESAWPVHGSVLVENEVAFFAAGRSSFLDGGIGMFAIDALNGTELHQRTLQGPRYTSENIVQNYQLPEGVLPDILRSEGDLFFMRAVPFDRELEQQEGKPSLEVRGGFLDDAYFKRMPWSMKTSGHARLIVNDERHAYCLRMFDSLTGLDPKVYFTPGKEGYLLYAHDVIAKKNVWACRVPIRGRALVATTGQLCLAGPPDVVDPSDPLAAFEGRKGGMLRIVDTNDGETMFEHPLCKPPVFNGAAAANRRLFLALEGGHVVCFGKVR